MALRFTLSRGIVIHYAAALLCVVVSGFLLSCGTVHENAAAMQPRKSVTLQQAETPIISEAQQDTLLALARRAIAAYLKNGTMAPPPLPADPALRQNRGCMVKLLKGEVPRGTSGYLLPIKPLAAGAAEMAVKATLGNQKNGPVTLPDLDSIVIEMSVISDPQPVEHSSAIRLGIHGLLVSSGPNVGGILLPGEASQIANPDSAIGTLLAMARSTREEWKNKEIAINTFSMQTFREQQK